jgi:hypothetical protein
MRHRVVGRALPEWIVRGLPRLGFTAVLMERRHVQAALSAQVVKVDRKDARATRIAQAKLP